MNTTSNSTSFSDLVHAANEWRKGIINRLWLSIRIINGTDVRVVTDDDVIGSIFADFLTTAHKPTDKAFSNSDVQFFIDLYESKRTVYNDQIADLHTQKGSWVREELSKRNVLSHKCNAVLSILNEEKDRRIAEKQLRIDNERATAKAKRDNEQAEHQAWLDKQRERFTAVKPKFNRKSPDYTPHTEKTIGKGLEALSVIKAEMDAKASGFSSAEEQKAVQDAASAILEARKVGKFVSERFVKKAEVIVLIGLDNIEKMYSTGSFTLPDYRLVEVKKSGAVTRFLLKE